QGQEAGGWHPREPHRRLHPQGVPARRLLPRRHRKAHRLPGAERPPGPRPGVHRAPHRRGRPARARGPGIPPRLRPMTFRTSRLAWNVLSRTAAAALLAFLVAPVLALILSITWADFTAGLAHPLAAPALKLSLLTSTCSLLLVTTLGTLLAWHLALGRG